MLRKKYGKTVIATALAVTLIGGIGGTGIAETLNNFIGSPTVAYAATSSFNSQGVGLKTSTGWITSKIKCVDNIPDNLSLEEMKKKAKKPTADIIIGTSPNYDNMNLMDEIYYYDSPVDSSGLKDDTFVKLLSMRVVESKEFAGKMVIERTFTILTYSSYGVINDSHVERSLKTTTEAYGPNDRKWIEYLQNEGNITPKPPTNKTYSASRLGGATRWETSTAIAKQVNGNKLDAVVLANAYNFPDALTGTTLAGNKKAPILLVGNNDKDTVTLNYIKNNLKSTGTVYVLGGSTVVSDGTLNKVKSLGFKNIKRLGGSDRYATNMSIVNELNVSKGSSVIIANSMSYADSLSISGISGASNIPIFLVNGSLTSSTLNKIKSIAPKNIYIVGSTTVVNSNIEKQLKSYGNVVRLGGKDRFETSFKIANYFTKDTQTTALVSYGLNFPDALAGGALASKTASPILLVNGDVTAQKAFLDKSNITKLYVLGSTSAVSDNIVKQLTK